MRKRHVWAIMDQGFYSASNFLINILLARYLTEEEYGSFATAFSVFLFLLLIHTAVLAEPMMVFGSRKYKNRIGKYYKVLLRFHGVFSGFFVILFLILACATFTIDEPYFSEAAIGIAFSLTFILLFYLFRKLCYVIDRVELAALGGFVYLLGVVVGIVALFYYNSLSIFSSFLLMATCSAFGAGFIHYLLKFPIVGKITKIQYYETWRTHVKYGKWALGTGILIWFPANIYYFVLPYVGGVEANASFKALMNFIMPVIQTNTAVANVLLPGLARIRNRAAFFAHLQKFVLIISAVCFCYWAVLGFGANTLLQFIYDGKYEYSRSLFWLVGGIPLISWLALSTRSALKAVERPDLVFWANLVSAFVSLTLGVVLTYYYGIMGAIFAMGLAYFSMFILLLFFNSRTKNVWVE